MTAETGHPSTGHYAADRLAAWMAGNLSAAECLEIEHHLETCDQCAQQLEQLESGTDPLVAKLRAITRHGGRAGQPVLRDENYLFGILALQAGLIDAKQFAEASLQWEASTDQSLADLLVATEMITAEDRDRLVSSLRSRCATVEPEEYRETLSPDTATTLQEFSPGAPLQLQELLSAGSVGKVWRAYDKSLGREVAVKQLRAELAQVPVVRGRFMREARTAAQLVHPGLVPVYRLHDEADACYYTMQFIQGQTLTEVIAASHSAHANDGTPLGLIDLLNHFNSVCNTIAYAHSHNIIHRDLKGENVVIGDYGEVVVIDWGLAKQLGDNQRESGSESVSTRNIQIDSPEFAFSTVRGERLGTPSFMAPEQIRGEIDQIDFRSDVYALGAILYELLCGQLPFVGENILEVMRRAANEPPQPPSEVYADVPPVLEAVCLKALSKQREDRYQSATDLGQAIRDWLAEQIEPAAEA